ncbi:MAG: hypothetical protein KKC51_14190 [Verrucomicrobia bacterium]|nr:hypothetical protein [Verrucomicrobiota bacterium]
MKLVLIIIISLTFVQHVRTQEQAHNLRVSWREVVRDDNFVPESILMAPSSGNDVWLVTNWRSRSRDTILDKWTVHKVADSGQAELLAECYWLIKGPAPAIDVSRLTDVSEINAICAAPNDELVMVGSNPNYRPQLLRMGNTGQQLSRHDIEFEIEKGVIVTNTDRAIIPKNLGTLEVASIIIDASGCFLMGAKEITYANDQDPGNNDGWILRMGQNYLRLWSRTYDFNQYDYIWSGVVVADGAIVLGVSSGEKDQRLGLSTDSKITMLQCDSEGNILEKKILGGRYPAITSMVDGKTCVVYDKASAYNADVWIAIFDKNLVAESEKRIVNINQKTVLGTIVPAITRFNASRLQSGDVLVAGWMLVGIRESDLVRDYTLLIRQFSSDGIEKGSLEIKPNIPVGGPVQIACQSNWACLGWIAIDQDTESQEVNLLRLDVADAVRQRVE